MAVKYILEKIKIDGALHDLLTKSNGDNVTVTCNGAGMTLNEALAALGAGTGGVTSGSIHDLRVLDAAEYAALETKPDTTLYLIRG